VTTDIPAELQAALGDRFELRRVLGRGGMATVYLAHDHRHHREVALKLFRPDLAASIGTDRFLHEIQIAARLTHPHILALHDSGEAGGFLFYVMPYIEGLSLRQRLEHHGMLMPAEVLSIVTPVAGALSYAHRMGVLHRDIKPENILFSEGHPVVADFGIAKAISTAGGVNLTRTGFPLGTPGYMSPEQALGLTDLDGRTDVYSLAVVTYEMLVGSVPGCWPTEDAVRSGRFLEASGPHRARLAQVGDRIECALVRALAVRLDQRTETPGHFIEELSGAAPPRRRFNQHEVQEIVRRASELEATSPTMSGALTLGGVEALAGEVGIPRDMVRSAAESLAMSDPPTDSGLLAPSNRWLGGPTKLLYERVIEGELPEGEFPVMVGEIRRVLQNVGQVSQLGRSFSWSSHRSSARTEIEVSVVVHGGRTRILIQENLANLIGGIYGGIGGGLGGGGMGPIAGGIAAGLGAPFLLPIVIPLWIATVYGIARTVYARSASKRQRTLQELGDRLVALARELALPPQSIISR